LTLLFQTPKRFFKIGLHFHFPIRFRGNGGRLAKLHSDVFHKVENQNRECNLSPQLVKYQLIDGGEQSNGGHGVTALT
jgi:hypothetical protein